ncbi:hypothetical protein F5Y04DRAFT_282234 [Hypomontagnella monticulosa]|nr:hypothetical protein F5Y04DRAFT_282234 [Hypomontagnella monticulosa]
MSVPSMTSDPATGPNSPSTPRREVDDMMTTPIHGSPEVLTITPARRANRPSIMVSDTDGHEIVDAIPVTPVSVHGRVGNAFRVPSGGSSDESNANSGSSTPFSPPRSAPIPIPGSSGPPSVGDLPFGSAHTPTGSPTGSIRTIRGIDSSASIRSGRAPSVVSSIRSWFTSNSPIAHQDDLEQQAIIHSVEQQHAYGSFPPIESYSQSGGMVEIWISVVCLLILIAILVCVLVKGFQDR